MNEKKEEEEEDVVVVVVEEEEEENTKKVFYFHGVSGLNIKNKFAVLLVTENNQNPQV